MPDEAAPFGVIACDRDANIIFWSSEAAQLTGVPSEAATGRALGEVAPGWMASAVLGALSQSADAPIVVMWLGPRSAQAAGSMGMHDHLTGLATRALFVEQLALALARLPRTNTVSAVFIVDLADFKVVNDAMGRDAGDQVLTEVARRLDHALRGSDTVARFGSDEFAVLCEELPNANAVGSVAARVGAALARPIEVQGRELTLTSAIGVTVLEETEHSPEGALRDATAAMHRAKQRGDDGRWGFEMFDRAVHEEAMRALEMTAELRRAITYGDLELHYQPEIDLTSGGIVTVEALVRWRRPDGLVPPNEFIPLAERSRLIIALGAWVLGEACRESAGWESTDGVSSVSVNLSGRQLDQPDLPAVLADALDESGLAPERLCVEITESSLMADPETAGQTLRAMKEMGVQVAVDDFGTGYSSLAYLKRFPVDWLKIDRSFVHGLVGDPGDAAIVRAVVALARSFGIGTVAEGVETDEQATLLREIGCDLAQGYLFAPPMPADRLQEMLSRAG